MNRERVFQVLIAPHVSEKAEKMTASHNQYVFRVANDATRREVKKAVEQLFKVTVDTVRTLRVKGEMKRTRHGRHSRQSGWKKAYVRLQQGQNIDLGAAQPGKE